MNAEKYYLYFETAGNYNNRLQRWNFHFESADNYDNKLQKFRFIILIYLICGKKCTCGVFFWGGGKKTWFWLHGLSQNVVKEFYKRCWTFFVLKYFFKISKIRCRKCHVCHIARLFSPRMKIKNMKKTKVNIFENQFHQIFENKSSEFFKNKTSSKHVEMIWICA